MRWSVHTASWIRRVDSWISLHVHASPSQSHPLSSSYRRCIWGHDLLRPIAKHYWICPSWILAERRPGIYLSAKFESGAPSSGNERSIPFSSFLGMAWVFWCSEQVVEESESRDSCGGGVDAKSRSPCPNAWRASSMGRFQSWSSEFRPSRLLSKTDLSRTAGGV